MTAFRNAIAGALKTVRTAAGADVVYRRGANEVTVRAGIGQTNLKLTTADSFEVRRKWRDYLIAADELVLAGTAVTPARGDLIIDGGETWQVANLPGGAPYDVEPRGVGLRIHVQRYEEGDA